MKWAIIACTGLVATEVTSNNSHIKWFAPQKPHTSAAFSKATEMFHGVPPKLTNQDELFLSIADRLQALLQGCAMSWNSSLSSSRFLIKWHSPWYVSPSAAASDAQTRWQGCHSDRRKQGNRLWGSPAHGQTGGTCYHRYSITHHTNTHWQDEHM